MKPPRGAVVWWQPICRGERTMSRREYLAKAVSPWLLSVWFVAGGVVALVAAPPPFVQQVFAANCYPDDPNSCPSGEICCGSTCCPSGDCKSCGCCPGNCISGYCCGASDTSYCSVDGCCPGQCIAGHCCGTNDGSYCSEDGCCSSEDHCVDGHCCPEGFDYYCSGQCAECPCDTL